MKTGRARMPWHGDIAHTKLPDGRVVLRGSEEAAQAMLDPKAVGTEPNSHGLDIKWERDSGIRRA